jgi:CelD/BcsL family acetyltransferase involved in cellulose biosynthesis
MQYNLIRNLPDMSALAVEWNELLANSASHVPFLRNEYLSTWWQTLGGGEWSQGELCVVTAHQDGRLAGIAPLFFTTNREGDPALMLLGCIEISDYLDLIAPAQVLQPFVDGLFDYLDGMGAPAWRVLDWWNFLSTSLTLPALETAAARHGWSYTSEALQHCPYIPIPGDWEVYLAGIEKKQRHEIRRKMRRLEIEIPSRWYIVEDEANLEAEVEAFMDMMAQDLNKRRFLTDTMRVQFQRSMREAFRAGWLQLAFLEISGEKAAGYINFDYLNSIWVYNSAINFKFREQSPGWVLLGYLLQWANEHQRAIFDFMRGDEDYKYRFGGVDRRVVRAVIRRR